ncbi:MAG TPA: hypothetical protein VEH77_16965 [Roseiarcus sp.]|nr:hypothetical protein [Roseiarcus sp.]
MLKLYIKATDLIDRLRSDKGGEVSLEYLIVAACVVGAVVATFGGGAGGILGRALAGGLNAIAGQVTAAV